MAAKKPEDNKETIKAVEKVLKRFDRGFAFYEKKYTHGAFDALKFVVIGKYMVLALPKERLLLLEGNEPRELEGIICDKYNVAVYAAVEALWLLKIIEEAQFSAFHKHLTEGDSKRRQELQRIQLHHQAAALGLRLVPK